MKIAVPGGALRGMSWGLRVHLSDLMNRAGRVRCPCRRPGPRSMVDNQHDDEAE
jgi:hypothetical protein